MSAGGFFTSLPRERGEPVAGKLSFAYPALFFWGTMNLA